METIRFATYHAEPVYTDIPRRTVREELPNWWAKFVVWVGDKTGVFLRDFERKVSYEVNQLDMRGAITEMLKHRHNIAMIQSKQAKYLIVGRDQMDRLQMQDWMARELGNISIPMGVMHGNDRVPHRYVYDLQVVFVPYIDGCFVLPELNGER